MDDKKSEFKQLLSQDALKEWQKLNRSVSELNQILEKSLQEKDMGLSRFQIFSLLYFEGPLRASEIAKKMHVTRGNISMFLKRLLADNLLRVSDKTASLKRPAYELNDNAQELFSDSFPIYIETIKSYMQENF